MDTYPVIKARMKTVASYYGLSERGFCESIGASPGSLSNASEPNGTTIQAVLRTYPLISPAWLVAGEGSMLRSGDRAPLQPEKVEEPTASYVKSKPRAEEMVTIPASLLASLQQQLENKDAQIATLMTIIGNTKN